QAYPPKPPTPPKRLRRLDRRRRVANGNTASNFLKNQRRFRSQGHCRFDGFISPTGNSWRARFLKLITAVLSPGKSWMLKEKTEHKSLLTLVIPICSCRFSGAGKLFMTRRALR